MKPVSKTAYYCCGVRMEDAQRERPVCGDVYAQRFMDDEGLRIHAEFRDERNPNASNVARHRIIDDMLRQELSACPELRIVLLGAGFDSRAYRLDGGQWFELDEPQLIACKNERLSAADCKNRLQRLPIDFSTESLADKLSPLAGAAPIVFVIEGVLVYLREDDVQQLLATLRRLFPRHTLICDLMTRKFFEQYSKTLHERIAGMGATFAFTDDHPEAMFHRADYARRERVSIVGQAIDWGMIRIPRFVLRWFLPTLREGYAVYRWELTPSPAAAGEPPV